MKCSLEKMQLYTNFLGNYFLSENAIWCFWLPKTAITTLSLVYIIHIISQFLDFLYWIVDDFIFLLVWRGRDWKPIIQCQNKWQALLCLTRYVMIKVLNTIITYLIKHKRARHLFFKYRPLRPGVTRTESGRKARELKIMWSLLCHSRACKLSAVTFECLSEQSTAWDDYSSCMWYLP